MLLIIRHGETVLNADGVYQGITDSSFSSKGINQIEGIAKYLNRFDLQKFKIYTSPLSRCKRTLTMISKTNFISDDIVIDNLLREQNYGVWESYRPEEISKLFPSEWKEYNYKKDFYRPLNGESFEDLKVRAKEWLTFNFYKEPQLDYLIVTHKKVSIALRQLLVSNRSHNDHPQNTLYEIDMITDQFIEHKIEEN